MHVGFCICEFSYMRIYESKNVHIRKLSFVYAHFGFRKCAYTEGCAYTEVRFHICAFCLTETVMFLLFWFLVGILWICFPKFYFFYNLNRFILVHFFQNPKHLYYTSLTAVIYNFISSKIAEKIKSGKINIVSSQTKWK